MTWVKTPADRQRDSEVYGAAWRRARQAQLQRQPMCELRYDGICQGTATEVDHIAERTLKRARVRARVQSDRRGFGQGSVWVLGPLGPHSGHSGQAPEAGLNGPNGGLNDEGLGVPRRHEDAIDAKPGELASTAPSVASSGGDQ